MQLLLQPRAASDGTIRDPRRLGLGGSRRLHYLMSISEYFVFWREGCGPCGCDGTNERSAGSCEGAGCRLPRGIPVQHMVLFFFPSAKDEARRVSALRCNLRWPTTHPRARGPEAASQLAVDAVDAVAGGAVRGGSVCQQGFAPSLGRASSGGLVGWWAGGGVCASKVGLHSGLTRQGSGLCLAGGSPPVPHCLHSLQQLQPFPQCSAGGITGLSSGCLPQQADACASLPTDDGW